MNLEAMSKDMDAALAEIAAAAREEALEEAAKIAEMTPMPKYGTNARINGQHEAKTKIVAAIRALMKKAAPFTKKEALAAKGESTFK